MHLASATLDDFPKCLAGLDEPCDEICRGLKPPNSDMTYA